MSPRAAATATATAAGTQTRPQAAAAAAGTRAHALAAEMQRAVLNNKEHTHQPCSPAPHLHIPQTQPKKQNKDAAAMAFFTYSSSFKDAFLRLPTAGATSPAEGGDGHAPELRLPSGGRLPASADFLL